MEASKTAKGLARDMIRRNPTSCCSRPFQVVMARRVRQDAGCHAPRTTQVALFHGRRHPPLPGAVLSDTGIRTLLQPEMHPYVTAPAARARAPRTQYYLLVLVLGIAGSLQLLLLYCFRRGTPVSVSHTSLGTVQSSGVSSCLLCTGSESLLLSTRHPALGTDCFCFADSAAIHEALFRPESPGTN